MIPQTAEEALLKEAFNESIQAGLDEGDVILSILCNIKLTPKQEFELFYMLGELYGEA